MLSNPLLLASEASEASDVDLAMRPCTSKRRCMNHKTLMLLPRYVVSLLPLSIQADLHVPSSCVWLIQERTAQERDLQLREE
jgi:hypothetical protein